MGNVLWDKLIFHCLQNHVYLYFIIYFMVYYIGIDNNNSAVRVRVIVDISFFWSGYSAWIVWCFTPNTTLYFWWNFGAFLTGIVRTWTCYLQLLFWITSLGCVPSWCFLCQFNSWQTENFVVRIQYIVGAAGCALVCFLFPVLLFLFVGSV